MIERFLLDGVNAKAAGATVRRQDDLVIFPGPDKAHAALPFIQFAVTGTEITLDTAVSQGMPKTGCYDRRYAVGHIVITYLHWGDKGMSDHVVNDREVAGQPDPPDGQEMGNGLMFVA